MMGKSLNILHVEDSENDALLVLALLKREGYTLYTERVDRPEAFREALERRSWDLILCDYAMPYFNGLQALALVQELKMDVPFIIVSGTIGEETAVAAMQAGAHDYILKDKLARLVPAIERELQEVKVRNARKTAETSLRESEARYRLLVEGIKDYAIYLLDVQGTVQTGNETAEWIKGYAGEDVLGKPFSCFFTPEAIRHGQPEHCLGVALKRGKFEEECWLIKKDGQPFWASLLVSPILQENGEHVGFSIIIRDLTELKHVEQTLQEALLKNLRKDQSLMYVSHELRSPLHSIITSTSMLQELYFGPLNEKQMEYLSLIQRNGQHLLQVINDMLDLAKMNSGKFTLNYQQNDMALFLEEVQAMVSPLLLVKQHQLVVTLDSHLPEAFWADPIRLKQVLNNLVTNAIKFSPDGTDIGLSCRVMGELLVMTVQDQGQGISPEDIEKIFEPFEQGKQVNLSFIKGTGLGLSWVKRMTELHGGKITVESRLGEGSSFSVHLPLCPAGVAETL